MYTVSEKDVCKYYVFFIMTLTGQQPVVFLQFEAVQNSLDMLQLLLLLFLEFFLQGSATFFLLLLLVQRLNLKKTRTASQISNKDS